jgi:putative transposase
MPISLEPGMYYHIYNRGNNRENIFIEDRNYSYFLMLFSRHLSPLMHLYAFCLMRNHFHLLVRIREGDEKGQLQVKQRNPSRAFANMFDAYTKSINKAYQRCGALFQRPFGRIPVMTE